MKDTFFRLNSSKREKIIECAIDEFSHKSYYNSSLDNIVAKAEISKGGLYAYIDSKDDLFIFLTKLVYDRLYAYIENEISRKSLTPPADILDRLYMVSGIAFDFYIENPNFVRFIVTNQQLKNEALESRSNAIFLEHFNAIFQSADKSGFRYPPEQIFDLLTWMLVKTRLDFLNALDSTADNASLKTLYLKKWKFYLDLLRNGIY